MNALPDDRRTGDLWVWHPKNLDVNALLEAYGQRVAEGVLWLGHCVFTGLADHARYRDTGRVPLKAEYLYRIIGRHHVDAVRQAAFEVGYVDRDPSYRAGHYSRAYWIVVPYDSARLVQREIADFGLRNNIRRWQKERRQEMLRTIEEDGSLVAAPVRRHLWDNLQRVRIDAGIDFSETLPESFHPAYQVAAARIRERRLWFKVDDYGRVHTNLTNLPRALRRCLSVDGERLANVDISESQPLFLGLAIARAFQARESLSSQTDGSPNVRRPDGSEPADQAEEKKAKQPGGGPLLPLRLTLFMFDKRPQFMFDSNPHVVGTLDRSRLPADLRHYLGLCEARHLYGTVADRLGLSRDEAKKLVMVVFFGKPRHRNAASPVFDELFPSLMETMRQMKRGDYRRLAHVAQRLESAFMFGQVLPHLMRSWPDLFIATVHDSVLTVEEQAEFVRQVVLNEFAPLGLSPQVKVERYSQRDQTPGGDHLPAGPVPSGTAGGLKK